MPDGHGGEKIVQLPRVSAWRPVPDEINRGAFALAIGEAPGVDEVRELRPFVGRSGQELMSGLGAFGLQRAHWSFANSLSCQPPQNEHEQLLLAVEAWNRTEKKRAKEEEGYVPQLYITPSEACRTRLLNVARQYSNVLVLGGVALKTMLKDWAETRRTKAGKAASPSIMDMRGGPLRLGLGADGRIYRDKGEGFPPVQIDHVWNVLPTVHPAHVLRSRRWRRVFRRDIGRAFRLFTGHVTWTESVRVVNPSPEKLRAFLFSGRPFLVCDLETLPANDQEQMGVLPPGFSEAYAELLQLEGDDDEDPASLDHRPGTRRRRKKRDKLTGKRQSKSALDPLRAVLALIGIGDAEVVYLVQIISKETGRRLLTEDEELKALEVVYDWLTSPHCMKAGWNIGYYDMQVLKRHLRLRLARAHDLLVDDMVPRRDGILDHHAYDPEFPHGLKFVASLHTDTPSWGEDHAATEVETDEAWRIYCARDVANNARLMPIGVQEVARRNQERVVQIDHVKQNLTCDLHEIGLRVDQHVRTRIEAETHRELQHWIVEAQRAAGKPVMRVEDGGFNPNSNDQVAHVLFEEWGLPVKAYTDTGKYSTDDETLIALFTDPAVQKQERRLLRCVRKVRNRVKKLGGFIYPARPFGAGGKVWPDGRIRTGWSSHIVRSGRLSSSDPINLQTIPVKMRPMYVPDPGHVFVFADFDQLELRIVAALAQAQSYLQIFSEGGDPHGALAELVWGALYKAAPGSKKSGAKGRMRSLAKQVVYACLPGRALVATLDRRGRKRLDRVGPGDWTWAWNGKCYEPARIVAARCIGVKTTYKVWLRTRGWRKPRAVEATADHRFLLRSGGYKRLDELSVGDRLMPFNRKTGGGKQAYRVVMAENDNRWVLEHRQVLPGFPVVHHRDEDTQNNQPDNLQGCRSAAEHGAAHIGRKMTLSNAERAKRSARLRCRWRDAGFRARVAAARIASPVWQAAIRENIKRTPTHVGGPIKITAKMRAAGRRNLKRAWAENHEEMLKRNTEGKKRSLVWWRARCRDERTARKKWRAASKPANHRVVSIEPVGEEPVWCLTVDHPAHNFALAPESGGVFVANSIYAAQVPTIHDLVVQAEDENEELIYFDHTLQETQAIHERWKEFAPEIPRWWERTVQEWRSRGFVSSAIFGRRFESLDSAIGDEELNELVNSVAQSTAADLADIATLKLRRQFPLNYAGLNTGIVLQLHDSLGIECPADDAERVAATMTEAMTQQHAQLPGVVLRAEAEIAMRWADLLCPGCGGNVDVGLRRWYPDDEKHKYCDNEGRCERKR